MHSVALLSLFLSLSFCSLLFSPSLVPAHLAASLSHFRTFSLIWQQSEPCRWKSFQRISRKLIYFCNKYDPFEWIHLYTSRCTKQEVVSGPRLPLLHTPRLSLPVYPTRWSHTYTHSSHKEFFSLLIVLKNHLCWFGITCTQGRAYITVIGVRFIFLSRFNNWLQEQCGVMRRAALQSHADRPGHHW